MNIEIVPFSKYESKYTINLQEQEQNKDNHGRDIRYITLHDRYIIGRNGVYPNCLLWNIESKELVSPYDEKVMSLNKESFYDGFYNVATNEKEILENSKLNKNNIEESQSPVFFFIYNFDNYYHFIYDTLPYLYTYFKLKETVPELKLLVSYPNITRNTFYKFNEDMFDIFDIRNDIIIHKENTLYKTVYIANSLTHSGMSNDPPHSKVYELFNSISISSHLNQHLQLQKRQFPKKIYISRRTWINNDKSNIGTDYTQRRKMINEDQLVEKLKEQGFEEVFCENLSMIEKIALFKQAEVIIGAIGGGMCNLLFSPPTTRVICIVSPYFLEINNRFRFSMDHTNITYIYNTTVFTSENRLPLYVRVKIIDENSAYYGKIGEIVDTIANNINDINDTNAYEIQLSNNDVAGFNNSINFEKVGFDAKQFELLDNGLNSPYTVNISNIINAL